MNLAMSSCVVLLVWSVSLMAQSRVLLSEESRRPIIGKRFQWFGLLLFIFCLIFVGVGIGVYDNNDVWISIGIALGVSGVGLRIQGASLVPSSDLKEIGKALGRWSWFMVGLAMVFLAVMVAKVSIPF